MNADREDLFSEILSSKIEILNKFKVGKNNLGNPCPNFLRAFRGKKTSLRPSAPLCPLRLIIGPVNLATLLTEICLLFPARPSTLGARPHFHQPSCITTGQGSRRFTTATPARRMWILASRWWCAARRSGWPASTRRRFAGRAARPAWWLAIFCGN